MGQLGVWRIGEAGPERVQPAAIDFEAPVEFWTEAHPKTSIPISPSPQWGSWGEGAIPLLPFQSEGDRRACAASALPGETYHILREKEPEQFGRYRTRQLVLEAGNMRKAKG